MTCIYPLISRVVRRSVLGEGLVFMLFFHPFNRMSSLVGGGGFSLPGVLVGVGLLGISSVIISNTVVDVRRSQQRADIKLSSNKLQQAVLDAVTGRIKEFMLDNCSGTRWGGTGSTEVEKAFSRIDIPLSGTSSGGASPALSFYKEAGGTPTSIPTSFECSEPAGPALMNSSDPNSGQYLRFCMNIDPTGHSSVSQRLLELLVVPIDLASDSAITCKKARGAAAGVKVTWQMHNKINNDKVKGSGSTVQVLKESGTFLISAETESYSGTCNIAATRQGTSDQCTVNVSGLGRRPPTLMINLPGAITNFEAATGFSWNRGSSLDSFSATVQCDTGRPVIFRAQSFAGSDYCDSQPLPYCIDVSCTAKYTYGGDEWKHEYCSTGLLVSDGWAWSTVDACSANAKAGPCQRLVGHFNKKDPSVPPETLDLGLRNWTPVNGEACDKVGQCNTSYLMKSEACRN